MGKYGQNPKLTVYEDKESFDAHYGLSSNEFFACMDRDEDVFVYTYINSIILFKKEHILVLTFPYSNEISKILFGTRTLNSFYNEMKDQHKNGLEWEDVFKIMAL